MAEEVGSEEGAAYGRFAEPPSRAEMERFFFLDDADRRLVDRRRGDRNRVGFALQLGTVRFLGTFLADPTDVPTAVVDYVAGQVGASDASCLKGYLSRRATRFEHTAEIVAAYGYRGFADVEAELERWVDDRAWTTGEGPAALFDGAVVWLRERRVLLPGVSRLARPVAHCPRRGHAAVVGCPVCHGDAKPGSDARATPRGAGRREGLGPGAAAPGADHTVGQGHGGRLGPGGRAVRPGLGSLNLDVVPRRRMVELARWGMAAKAPGLRRHPSSRKLATLLATVVYLEAKATDDALELFDVLMVNELMARAQRQ